MPNTTLKLHPKFVAVKPNDRGKCPNCGQHEIAVGRLAFSCRNSLCRPSGTEQNIGSEIHTIKTEK